MHENAPLERIETHCFLLRGHSKNTLTRQVTGTGNNNGMQIIPYFSKNKKDMKPFHIDR